MSKKHITQLMMEFLYRDVLHDAETQKSVADRFTKAPTKTAAVNQIGFAFGLIPPTVADLDQFATDGLFDAKVHKRLLAIVERMPSLEFMFVPLVLSSEKAGLSLMPLLRVRKLPGKDDQIQYLEYASLRLYDRFAQFLEANRLPNGTLWYPTDGVVRFDADGQLLVSSRKLSNTVRTVLKGVSIAGNVAATALAFTPIAPVASPILLLASNVPLIGFSIADLVDGCRYERGTVIAGRSAALVVNLITFSSVGLTAACKATKLRNILPADKLLLLDQAEVVLQVTTKAVSSAHAAYSVVGSLADWHSLSGAEWVQVAANLCFAFRTIISKEAVEGLMNFLLEHGVVQFFRLFFANVAPGALKPYLAKCLDQLLDLVDFLQRSPVQFTVDDDFTTLRAFDYELKFETLFQLDRKLMASLLQHLGSYVVPIRQLATGLQGDPFTQEVFHGTVALVKLVGELKNVPCELDAYIYLGKRHRFSFATVLAWSNAPSHNRLELLRALAGLDAEQTAQLNEIRASRLGAAGDAGFFRWLVAAATGKSDEPGRYESALACLLTVAARADGGKLIVFREQQLVVNELLALSVEELRSADDASIGTLLHDTRFLQFCHQVDKGDHMAAPVPLVQRARAVWLRSYRSPACQFTVRETLALLEGLFNGCPPGLPAPPLTLAEALHFALADETATVETVFYMVLFAWHVRARDPRPAFDPTVMRNYFRHLKEVATDLRMGDHMLLDPGSTTTTGDAADDQRLIEIARLVLRETGTTGDGTAEERVFFGTPERAACWLHLMPALRGEPGRRWFNETLRTVVQSGDGQVLRSDGPPLADSPRRVRFARGAASVVFEMVPLACGKWQAWIKLGSLSLKPKASFAKGKNVAPSVAAN